MHPEAQKCDLDPASTQTTERDSEIMHLDELLERLRKAETEGNRVSLGTMIEVMGERSFAPMLVFAGMIALSPLSGLPGVPTLVAVMVLLTTIQLLIGREHFWLPQWVIRRTVSREKYERSLNFMEPVARIIDKVFRPRLTILTRQIGVYLVAIMCILIAITMPPMEIVPFAATTAGAAIVTFGLSLMARDGVMTLVAIVFTATAGITVSLGII